jgi:hypothetical protein
MSTHFQDISAALDNKLNTFAAANNIPVAWENIGYKPIIGTMFLRPTLLPGDTDSPGLSYTSALDHIGVYQVDVISPIDKGKGQAITTADLVATAFPRGELVYNGKTVTIKQASRRPGSRDNAWYIVPVIINYRSITGN